LYEIGQAALDRSARFSTRSGWLSTCSKVEISGQAVTVFYGELAGHPSDV
jgi:hypothetical protein